LKNASPINKTYVPDETEAAFQAFLALLEGVETRLAVTNQSQTPTVKPIKAAATRLLNRVPVTRSHIQ
jgi:hypothetical protein